MASNTTMYPALANVIHDNWFTLSLTGNPDDWNEFAGYASCEDMRPFVREQTWFGTGPFYEKPQLQPVVFDDPGQAYAQVATYATFALACVVSKELIREDEFGIIPQIPTFLRYGAKITRNKKIWGIANNAATSTITGGDGVSLANASHPLAKTGALFSNTQGSAAISPTVLQTMFLNFQLYKDDTGLEDMRTPVTLWVPPQLQQAAAEILGTGPKAPYTTNNTINIHMNRVEVKVSRFMTSSTAFFLAAAKPGDEMNGNKLHFVSDSHKIKYFEEWPEEVTIFDHPESLGLQIMCDLRFTGAFFDWRGFEWSTGA
jgi:hypothetical protein